MNVNANRSAIIKGIFIVISFLFVAKLFYIQVLDNTYKKSAAGNVIRYDIQYPGRGLLFDRNKKLMAFNEASYDLMVVPREVPHNIDSILLCNLLQITPEEYSKRMKKAKIYSNYKESVFAKKIDAITFAKLQEMLYKFQGFFERARSSRIYPTNTAAHVLGYLGEVNDNIIAQDNYYISGDFIGTSGVEKSFEKELRGKKGMELVLVDVHNKEQGKFNDGEYDTLAIAGSNIMMTIDADLQQYGEELLQNKIGSIVAIEPSTGEILALVSSTTYNPNELTGSNRAVNFSKLNKDKNKPLFNRALLGQYAPGSTFKLINGLIALEENVLDQDAIFYCQGGYRYGKDKKMGCHKHDPPVNLHQAVAISCNSYFCDTYQKLFHKYKDADIAYDVWNKHVSSFGIGQWMNNDFSSGSKGFLPTVEYFDKVYGKKHWNVNTILSLSIGQGELLLTPIQLANITAIIANRGYYYTPHIVKMIDNKIVSNENFTKKKFTSISPTHFIPIIDGMEMVLSSDHGTARYYKVENISICGKTGTAQNNSGNGKDHSIFIAFAPKDKPKIAIAVIVENGGWGATWAAPMATLMIEKYLTKETTNKNSEEFILKGNLIATP